jgi:uncharacterized membrane protein HdeD (DUF308 family)
MNMNSLMQGKWWFLVLRGILAIVLGLIVLANLKAGVMAVLLFLGYYAILEGLLKLGEVYVHYKTGAEFWHTLLAALGSIVIGILIITWPRISVIILIALIATQALIQAASDIYAAIRGRTELEKSKLWLLVLGGIAQLFFGLWMIFQPVIGGLTVVAVLAIYAIVIGVILILRGFQDRFGGGAGSVAAA